MTIQKVPPPLNVHYHLYRKIALTFFVISILLFIGIFYFTYRKVVIKIDPAYELASKEFIVDIKERPEASKNELKGRILQEILEGNFEYNVESETEEIKDEVTGMIKIINNSARGQTLVATTRFLRDDGLLFRLKKYVKVPAEGSIEAEIYADDSKKVTEEVEPSKFTIPGLSENLQKLIYAETYEPIKPNIQKIKIVFEDDLAKAKEEALKNLSKEALVRFAKNIKTSEKLLPNSIDKEIVEFKVDKEKEEKAEKLNSHLKVKFTTVLFDEEELFKLAQSNLESTLPEGKKLTEIVKESFLYSIEKYDLEGNVANLRVLIASKMSVSAENEIFAKEKIEGLTQEEALSYLKSFKEIKDVSIEFSPKWWRRIPRLKNAIKIIITE